MQALSYDSFAKSNDSSALPPSRVFMGKMLTPASIRLQKMEKYEKASLENIKINNEINAHIMLNNMPARAHDASFL